MNRLHIAIPLLSAAALALSACTPAVVAGMTTLGVTSAQERSIEEAFSDTEINARLDSALIGDANPALTAVQTRVIEGRAILMGALVHPEDALAAETIAWAIPGVRGVENAIETGTGRTTGQSATDFRIASDARLRILAGSGFNSANFAVNVINRTLHLSGIAESSATLSAAVETVRNVRGVERVVSHVLLANDPRRLQELGPTPAN